MLQAGAGELGAGMAELRLISSHFFAGFNPTGEAIIWLVGLGTITAGAVILFS